MYKGKNDVKIDRSNVTLSEFQKVLDDPFYNVLEILSFEKVEFGYDIVIIYKDRY